MHILNKSYITEQIVSTHFPLFILDLDQAQSILLVQEPIPAPNALFKTRYTWDTPLLYLWYALESLFIIMFPK